MDQPDLLSLLAEIYGTNYDDQIKVAKQVKTILEDTSNMVDINSMDEDNQTEYKLEVDIFIERTSSFEFVC